MKPAVAVMARVPGAGPVKSRLHAALGAEGAARLYRCFLLDRLDAVAAVPGITPVLAFTPAEAAAAMAALAPPGIRLIAQHGGDLGQRLARLLAGLLQDGHAAALAMDSDSPSLPMAHVATAADRLSAGAADVVLGPAADGGYYLVGVRAPCPGLFEDIPWSTPDVLARTRACADAAGLAVHLLPGWYDVDTPADLDRLREDLTACPSRAPRTAAFLAAGPGPPGVAVER